jgi:hypothetical protein
MPLNDKERKLLSLALNPAVQPGEMVNAAVKLIESFRKRDVQVSDFDVPQTLAVSARAERKFCRPDYGLCVWPWGSKYKGQMFKDLPPQYLQNQMRWIREDPLRATRFAELATQIEMFLSQ